MLSKVYSCGVMGIEGFEGTLGEKTVNGRTHLIHVGELMSRAEMREIARKAGCHIYSEDDLVLYGDNRFLFALTKEACDTHISFLDDKARIDYLEGSAQSGKEDAVSLGECGYKLYLFGEN